MSNSAFAIWFFMRRAPIRSVSCGFMPRTCCRACAGFSDRAGWEYRLKASANTLTLTALEGVPSVAAGDDLGALIVAAARTSAIDFRDGDVLVLAQKIVSKAEGRQISLSSVEPSGRARQLAMEVQKDARVIELILRESKEVIRCRPGLIIVEHRLGLVMANAGIDASNVDRPDGDDAVLLLPEDPDRSAAEIRQAIRAATQADVGV